MVPKAKGQRHHPVTRRRFLQLGTASFASAAALGTLNGSLNSQRRANGDSGPAPHPPEKVVPSVCLLCPAGCGVLARVVGGRLVKLEGSPMHPINLGALCPKGQAAPELLYNPDRLTQPLLRAGERGEDQWRTLTWDDAVELVATKLTDLRAAGHPEGAALLYGEARGRMRSFIERFMAAVGSPNAISRDSLNVEAAKLAMYYTQGIYDLPAYDLEKCNYILSFGASLLEAGRSPQRMVAGYSYMRRGRAVRGHLVVVDPRQGITGAKADEWIPIRPGTDGALALGMANVLIRSGLVDESMVNGYAFGFDDFKDRSGRKHKGFKSFVLENYSPQRVAKICGVPATTVARLAGEFAGHAPAVAVMPGKGGLLNGSISGLYSAMAIHCLNALVGNIDQPGGVLTQRYMPCPAWPRLPADPVARRGRKAPRLDGAGGRFPLGRHSYQSVADRILAGEEVDVVLMLDSNPVYETPGGERFARALAQVPFSVSLTSFMDETARHVDLVLPQPTFLERWEDDAIEALGYPGIALRQPVVEPLHDTMAAGDFLLRVARAMGGPVDRALPWDSYQEVVRESIVGSGADWDTVMELGLWIAPNYIHARRGSNRWLQEVVGRDRVAAPRDGRFDFFSREMSCALGDRSAADLKALGIRQAGDAAFLPHHEDVAYAGEVEEYPFLLNVVTLMSLGPYSCTSNMPTLQEISGMTVGETWGGWVEMNPAAARARGITDGDAVWVESPFARARTVLKLVEALRPDVVNMPYNQGHTAVGRWAKGRGVNGLDLINPSSEPATGLAALTNTRVKVYRA